MDALGDQRLDTVFDAVLPATVCEAAATAGTAIWRNRMTRNNSAPAFEVIAPPSNAAMLLRLPRLVKVKCWLRSVGIGAVYLRQGNPL